MVADDNVAREVIWCGGWYDIEDPRQRKIPATPHSSEDSLSNGGAVPLFT